MAKLKPVINGRRRTKERMIAAFGNQCCVCKKTYPLEIFEFHHLDPDEKNFGIGSVKSISWDCLVIELRKCVMVCANCHRLIDYGYITIPDEIVRFNESYSKWQKKK